MTNYRAVSLLTLFPKVANKAKNSRLSQCVHTYNILVTEQRGFRQGRI